MRNDNKLGKEKQKNKQMVSYPLVYFLLSVVLLSSLGGSRPCPTADKWQRTCPFKDSGRKWNNHFNYLELAHDCYFYERDGFLVEGTQKHIKVSLQVSGREYYCISEESCIKALKGAAQNMMDFLK